MAQMVKVTCRKCHQTFTLNIGKNTLDEAIEMLKQTKGFECTAGHHVELGSPMDYWTIHPETIHEAEPTTDEDWLEKLKAKVPDGEVWDTHEAETERPGKKFALTLERVLLENGITGSFLRRQA